MKDFLVWPVTIALVFLALGFLFLILFRVEIAGLILRLRRASKDGIDFDRGAAAQPDQPAQPKLSYDDLMQKPVSDTVRAQESQLIVDLEAFHPKDDKQRVSLLMRSLALQMVNAEFARIYHTIFGSQMELLVTLVSRSRPVSMSEVEDGFATAKTAHSDFYKNTDVNEWLRFLVQNSLVDHIGDQIDLTQKGKDFLKFLIDTRSAAPRPF